MRGSLVCDPLLSEVDCSEDEEQRHQAFNKQLADFFFIFNQLINQYNQPEFLNELKVVLANNNQFTDRVRKFKSQIKNLKLQGELLQSAAISLLSNEAAQSLKADAENPALSLPKVYHDIFNKLIEHHEKALFDKRDMTCAKVESLYKSADHLLGSSMSLGLLSLFALPAFAASAKAGIIAAGVCGGLWVGVPLLVGLTFAATASLFVLSDKIFECKLKRKEQKQLNEWESNPGDGAKIRFFRAEKAMQNEVIQEGLKLTRN